MNRSEFFRLAGTKLADELEDEAELTAMANVALARAGQPAGDGTFLRESERIGREATDW